ncbi:1322_t:CDS:2 [Funneliformis mosseae]|uniref:1322_t:CDS:1 n=1 Tax=Funneliformis mosseae TaxID=27381 RepID=A0A9N8VTW2_FUNMO|nr:1322_t:CDS:2 [Funneliformis mosseae]
MAMFNDFLSFLIAICIIVWIVKKLRAGQTAQTVVGNRRGNDVANEVPRARLRTVTPDMIETVCAMFPNIPPAAVQYDLQKTGSVEVTCDNILQNDGLPLPPSYVTAPFAVPSAAQASTSSTGINISSTQQSLIERYKLQDAVKKGLIPSEPPKKWEATAEKRQEMLQLKKDAMVLQARERFLEQQRKKHKEEVETRAKNDSDNTTSFQSQPTNQTNFNNNDNEEVTLEPEVRRRQILQATERRWKKDV